MNGPVARWGAPAAGGALSPKPVRAVEPVVKAPGYLVRAVIALVAVGVLVGGVWGVRAVADTSTAGVGPVVQALAPVAVDGARSSDPVTVPVNVAVPMGAPVPVAAVSAPGVPLIGGPGFGDSGGGVAVLGVGGGPGQDD